MGRPYSILVAAACLFFLLGLYHLLDRSSTYMPLIVGLALLPVITQIVSGNVKINFFRPYSIALLALLIVNIQPYVDFMAGNISVHSREWADDEIVAKSALLSAIGLVALVGAYSLLSKRRFVIREVKERVVSELPLALLAAILLFGYFATANRIYFSGHYGVESVGQTAAYFIQLFKAAFFAAVIVKTRNMKLRGAGKASVVDFFRRLGPVLNITLLMYLFSVLLSGDRGPLISYVLFIIGNYIYATGRPLSSRLSILVVIVGAIGISVLGDIRAYDRDMSFSERISMRAKSGESRFENNSISPVTQNLANSNRTLHIVVSYFPDSHPHTNGLFLAKQVLAIVPFTGMLGEKISPSPSYRYQSTSNFTTWLVYGDNPTSGEGTTAVADLYVEFGLLGVVLGMGFLGGMLCISEKSIGSSWLIPLSVHAAALVYVSNAVYIARASVFTDLKIIAWVIILLKANQMLSKLSASVAANRAEGG